MRQTDHERFIRQCFDLAISAGKKGNHTFGSLLVYQGEVVLTAENTVLTDDDNTRHAELNLMAEAKRKLPPEARRQSTLYTSTAPCMMCSGIAFYTGIKKVVFGVSYEAFDKLLGQKQKTVSCDELYRLSGAELEWVGPVLEEEGLLVFRYWPESDPHSFHFHKK